MQFDSYCIQCLVERENRLAHKLLPPREADAYLRECMELILSAPEGVSAPYLVHLFRKALERRGLTQDLYAEEKRTSNAYALRVLPEAEAIVAASEDPLLTALKFAQAGNFMDFGVLDKEQVDTLLRKAVADAPNVPLNEAEYAFFRRDLANAKQLLILGDNAGEIAFDTILVKQLRKQYPDLHIVYGVRGGNALNDATREDAAEVGMDRLVPIVDNGSAISGTELFCLGDEMREALETSDVILAKGQANFETMVTGGYNVYYNFFCKCARLQKILGVPLYSGVFLNERRLPEIDPFPA
ncbi:MAG: DUF89 family protein [Oscillospiraceae bacterium]|nr:DUF89 family protein [Oscillospiraceae bacterium]